MRVLVAITGASGFELAAALLDALKRAGVERHLIVSENAQRVRELETDMSLDQLKTMCEEYYDSNDIASRICSGGFRVDAMAVVPCSMNTLAAIAAGIEDSALTRAVGVNLKMERRVVLVPRNTPLTLIQLENLVTAKKAGCSIVLPLVPYYNRPKTVAECTAYTTGRVLELLGLEQKEYKAWDGK